MTCKECKHYIQGEGRCGSCALRPQYKPRRINGRPNTAMKPFVIHWSHMACKRFEIGGMTIEETLDVCKVQEAIANEFVKAKAIEYVKDPLMYAVYTVWEKLMEGETL